MTARLADGDHDRKIEAREREEAARERQGRIAAALDQLRRDTGARLAEASLSDLTIYDEKQRAVVARLKKLAICDHVKRAGGLILAGPTGTAKDHCAVALLRDVAKHGFTARWRNGQDLYSAVAAAYRDESSERDVLRELIAADVLCLSDPVLPFGMSDSNRRTLYRLINERYDRSRSTWVTMNVTTESQAIELLGPQSYSRLLDGAVCLFCNWEDYRRRNVIQ